MNTPGAVTRHYILSSAVLTSFGTFTYAPLTARQGCDWLNQPCVCDHSSGQVDGETCRTCGGSGRRWTSTIGYLETARALEALCGIPEGSVPVNRVQITMNPGDEALVFRLVLPTGSPRIDPKDKGQIARYLDAGYWELGRICRMA